MEELEKEIISVLMHNPGFSDGELAEVINGEAKTSKYINQNCRLMESQGLILRHQRQDGLIGNWLIKTRDTQSIFRENEIKNKSQGISEKKIKIILSDHLASQGWEARVCWGSSHRIDIEAKQDNRRWIIQVRGSGLFHQNIINNFLSVLGEIIQRMDDPNVKYSIALPDTEQFHRLWERVPTLAKSRLEVTALFIHPQGQVKEEC